MEWEAMVRGRAFITALSDEYIDRENSTICRYAVWIPGNDMVGHRIAEVNNNLQVLKEKYQVPDEMVLEMK